MLNFLKTFVVSILLLSTQLLYGYNKDLRLPALSTSSRVSLLTVGRSDAEVYQCFGHTAIRVLDPVYGWDFVYNYGTFNFAEPGFLIKFIRGKLLYFESIDNYPEFEQMYREENRWIREQPLNLTQEEKQTLFERLTVNAREENKYYKYDFLFDNCSTRPRDIILSLFKKVQVKKDIDDAATFRQLIGRNVNDKWLDLGMDLLIGVPTDQKAKFGRTFLPIELMESFDSAVVDGKPLVSGNNLLLDAVPEVQPVHWFTPGFAFWFLLFFMILLQVKVAALSKYRILPVAYLSVLGLFGWLFLLMWFCTDHASTKWNLNILWAMPFNIPLLFFVFKKQLPSWLLMYIKIYRILLISILAVWWVNPQAYNPAVIPLVLLAILCTSLFLPVPTQEDFRRRWFR